MDRVTKRKLALQPLGRKMNAQGFVRVVFLRLGRIALSQIQKVLENSLLDRYRHDTVLDSAPSIRHSHRRRHGIATYW